MSQPPLIGIAGAARTGKDTLANFIIAAIGGYRYGFADPIREMMKPLGIDMSDPYWQVNKENVIPALGVSPRRIMQTLGTDWGRQMINARLWIFLANQRLLAFGPGMVISDVRFEDEADWIRQHGGLILHIQRDVQAVEEHVSENGVQIQDVDFVIKNDGSLEDLQNIVKNIFHVQ